MRLALGLALALLASPSLATERPTPQSCLSTHATFQAELGVLLEAMESVAVAEESSAIGAARSPTREAKHDLTNLIVSATPSQMEGLCSLFRDEPELAWALGELSEVADGSQARGGNLCFELSQGAYQAFVVATAILRGLADLTQLLCDATTCVPLAEVGCVLSCSFAGVFGALASFAEIGLSGSEYCGEENHVERFADNSEIATARSYDLSESLSQTAGRLLGTTVSSRAAKVDLVGATQGAASGIDHTQESISDLATILEARHQEDLGFLRLALRSDIELALAGRGRLGGQSILLRMPTSVGGLLEKARDVVARTITSAQGLGQDVLAALVAFDEGDAALNREDYSGAFEKYREAYALVSTATQSQR